jgi:hypothetical protein
VEEGLGPDSMPCEVWCCEMERCNTILTIAYQTPDALAGDVQWLRPVYVVARTLCGVCNGMVVTGWLAL